MRSPVVLVVAVVLAAGCGRSTGEEFRDDALRPVQVRLDERQARVAATLRVVRPRRRRDALALDADVRRLAGEIDRVAGLSPPGEARAAFDPYVRALRGVTAQLDRFTAALRSGADGEIVALTERVAAAVGSAQRAREELDRVLLAD